MIRSELREKVAFAIWDAMDVADGLDMAAAEKYADEALSIPHLKEALDFYEACQSAFEVNGEFKVTKEALRGKGGVSASL